MVEKPPAFFNKLLEPVIDRSGLNRRYLSLPCARQSTPNIGLARKKKAAGVRTGRMSQWTSGEETNSVGSGFGVNTRGWRAGLKSY